MIRARPIDAATVLLYGGFVGLLAGLHMAGGISDRAALVALGAALPASILAARRIEGLAGAVLPTRLCK